MWPNGFNYGIYGNQNNRTRRYRRQYSSATL